jgi:putative membrane protein
MALAKSRLFTEKDVEKIRSAVGAAEKRTSGEIVPFVVERSDDYEEAEWRAGALGFALVMCAVTAFYWFSESWHSYDLLLLGLDTGAAFFVGFLAARYLPPLKRFFAGRALLDRRVESRAAGAFLSEEVFATAERTGILIFVSLLEHRVVVLGDSGINAKVEKKEWEGIVATIVDGIKRGAPADGLVSAIEQSGGLLERTGVRRSATDRDELPDAPRVRDR